MNQETMISHYEIVLQLFLAGILGGLIGLERELKSWFAGLRTHILVCVGSTLIMIVSQYGFASSLQKDLIVLDPSRMAAQVVSGIGFLGAGTILFRNNMIRGLTTAAGLWAVAAVGLAIGGGLYLAAVIATIFILIVLAGIKPLEQTLFKPQNIRETKFSISPAISLETLEGILITSNLRSFLKDIEIETDGIKEIFILTFQGSLKANLSKFADELRKLPGVEKIKINEQ